jgi:hypothetical protein
VSTASVVMSTAGTTPGDSRLDQAPPARSQGSELIMAICRDVEGGRLRWLVQQDAKLLERIVTAPRIRHAERSSQERLPPLCQNSAGRHVSAYLLFIAMVLMSTL